MVILEDVKLLLDLINTSDSNIASLLEAVGNFERVDALIQKFLSLLKDCTSEDDNTGCSITDLVILRSRQLCQESGCLMVDLLSINHKQVKVSIALLGTR